MFRGIAPVVRGRRRRVGHIVHGVSGRRAQNDSEAELSCAANSGIMPTPGLCHLEVPVHESMVTSVHDRGEPRASDEGASVDHTEAGCRTRIHSGQAEHRSVRTWKGASRRGSAVARGLLACSATTFTGSRQSHLTKGEFGSITLRTAALLAKTPRRESFS
jgi:hypothetical protein